MKTNINMNSLKKCNGNFKQGMLLSSPQCLSMFLSETMAHRKSYNVPFDRHGPAFEIFYLFLLLGNAMIEEFISTLQKYEKPLL